MTRFDIKESVFERLSIISLLETEQDQQLYEFLKLRNSCLFALLPSAHLIVSPLDKKVLTYQPSQYSFTRHISLCISESYSHMKVLNRKLCQNKFTT